MAKPPTTTTAPTGNIPPFGLRMLPELRAQIEEAARSSGRSMNAEIVSRLEASLSGEGSGLDTVLLRKLQLELAESELHHYAARASVGTLGICLVQLLDIAAAGRPLTEDEQVKYEAIADWSKEAAKLGPIHWHIDTMLNKLNRAQEALDSALAATQASTQPPTSTKPDVELEAAPVKRRRRPPRPADPKD